MIACFNLALFKHKVFNHMRGDKYDSMQTSKPICWLRRP